MSKKENSADLVISCSVDFHDELRVSESYDGLAFNINNETVVIEGLDLLRLCERINQHLSKKP